MFIQTEATPNPATLKFIPGRTVLDTGTMEFSSREAAARSPLAERLFGVSGVSSVFYGYDFVTVTKADGDWQQLKPAILGAIMEHYMSGAPLLADGSVRLRVRAVRAELDDERHSACELGAEVFDVDHEAAQRPDRPAPALRGAGGGGGRLHLQGRAGR